MADDRTATSRSLFSRVARARAHEEVPALVLIWSPWEPHRVGEVLLIPPDSSERIWKLGRGKGQGSEVRERLELLRQRPGVNEPTGALQSPGVSRNQLELRSPGRNELLIQNVGRCALLHNNLPVQDCILRPGDTISLKGQLVFYFQHRPVNLPALHRLARHPLHPFGKADRFGMVGEGPEAWKLRQQVAFIGRRVEHVLIRGASGTGKELAAQAIHQGSSRRAKSLVSRNAATIPEGLIDGELFGNVRNYPNAGLPERVGLLGQADGSSLFLDEFAELSPTLQAHLLRVLDDGEYQRLGESSMQRSDFRLIAATNRPLSEIKEDVLARLTLRLPMPDLNARREDIPLLTRAILRQIAEENPDIAGQFFAGERPEWEPRVSPTFTTFLVTRNYTTNVRELRGLLWQSIQESSEAFLSLPSSLLVGARAPSSEGIQAASADQLAANQAKPAGPVAGTDPQHWPEQGAMQVKGMPPETPASPVRVTAAEPGPPLPSPQQLPGSDVANVQNAQPESQAVGGLDQDELELLALHRRYRFRVSECCQDPSYQVDRATADMHLRALLCKALILNQFQLESTADLLAGGDALLEVSIRQRLETMLGNLRKRLQTEGSEALRARLMRQLRSRFCWVEPVIVALENGSISLPPEEDPPPAY